MSKSDTRSKIAQLFILFTVALAALLAVAKYSLPPMPEEDYAHIKLPRSMADVRDLSNVLSKYTEDSYFRVMNMIVCIYIFLQTFSIPGTTFINVLCGALFGFKAAFVLCLLNATFGASGAFCLSFFVGRTLLARFAKDKLKFFEDEMNKHRENLFWFLMFLRISPVLPNWFVNMSCPLFHVPFPLFFLITFIGLIPATIMQVNAGVTLVDLAAEGGPESSVLGIRALAMLMGIGLLSLLPVVIKRVFAKEEASKKMHMQ